MHHGPPRVRAYARGVAVSERVFVSLDCAEPLPLAAFWAAMLDGEVMFTTVNAVGVRAGGMWLTAIRIPDYRPPSWPGDEVPKQMHLDLAVTDLESAAAEAVGLGARAAAHQPAPDLRRILLDPAGHPFCLTTQIPLAGQ